MPFGRRMMMRGGVEKSRPLIQALEEIAADHEATPTQVVLSWLINFHGDTVVAIPGASKVHHAQEAAGAMTLALTEDEMDRLDNLSASFR